MKVDNVTSRDFQLSFASTSINYTFSLPNFFLSIKEDVIFLRCQVHFGEVVSCVILVVRYLANEKLYHVTLKEREIHAGGGGGGFVKALLHHQKHCWMDYLTRYGVALIVVANTTTKVKGRFSGRRTSFGGEKSGREERKRSTKALAVLCHRRGPYDFSTYLLSPGSFWQRNLT